MWWCARGSGAHLFGIPACRGGNPTCSPRRGGRRESCRRRVARRSPPAPLRSPRAVQPARAAPRVPQRRSLVALSVTVQDKNAKYVGGLQPTTSWSTRTASSRRSGSSSRLHVPLDLIVLIDTSSSMARQDRHRPRRRARVPEDAARGRPRRGGRLRRLGFQCCSRSPPTARRSNKAVRSTGGARLDVAEQRPLRRAQAVRPGRAATEARCAARRSSSCPTATTPSSLVSFDDVLGAGAEERASTSTRSSLQSQELPRTSASSRGVFLRVRLRDEVAGARDRRRSRSSRSRRELKGVYGAIADGAREPVLDRLRAGERPRRRPLPARRRAGRDEARLRPRTRPGLHRRASAVAQDGDRQRSGGSMAR